MTQEEQIIYEEFCSINDLEYDQINATWAVRFAKYYEEHLQNNMSKEKQTSEKQQVDQLVQDVQDGNADALAVFIELKRLSSQVESAIKQIKDEAVDEANKYGKSFEMQGAKITVKSAATRYKYDHIPEWKQHKEQLKAIEELAKQALKARQNKLYVSDDEGIISEPAKAIPGADTLSISFS